MSFLQKDLSSIMMVCSRVGIPAMLWMYLVELGLGSLRMVRKILFCIMCN